jgi:hypothetical protein
MPELDRRGRVTDGNSPKRWIGRSPAASSSIGNGVDEILADVAANWPVYSPWRGAGLTVAGCGTHRGGVRDSPCSAAGLTVLLRGTHRAPSRDSPWSFAGLTVLSCGTHPEHAPFRAVGGGERAARVMLIV